jgi:hypothetical protein
MSVLGDLETELISMLQPLTVTGGEGGHLKEIVAHARRLDSREDVDELIGLYRERAPIGLLSLSDDVGKARNSQPANAAKPDCDVSVNLATLFTSVRGPRDDERKLQDYETHDLVQRFITDQIIDPASFPLLARFDHVYYQDSIRWVDNEGLVRIYHFKIRVRWRTTGP